MGCPRPMRTKSTPIFWPSSEGPQPARHLLKKNTRWSRKGELNAISFHSVSRRTESHWDRRGFRCGVRTPDIEDVRRLDQAISGHHSGDQRDWLLVPGP